MTQPSPTLDRAGVLRRIDFLARSIRAAATARIDALRAELGPVPQEPEARRRWAAALPPSPRELLAAYEELGRVRAEAGRAWVEDRWADLAALALRHRRLLRLDDSVLAVVHGLEDSLGVRAAGAGPGM